METEKGKIRGFTGVKIAKSNCPVNPIDFEGEAASLQVIKGGNFKTNPIILTWQRCTSKGGVPLSH